MKQPIFWVAFLLFVVGAMGVLADTGGTITTNGSYIIHTFTGNGTYTATYTHAVEILVVGGGGGGGDSIEVSATYPGAGGGAGGLKYNSSYSVAPGTYTVVIGKGGAAGASDTAGKTGTGSAFSTMSVSGGGGGGTINAPPGNGSSGGGASNSVSPGGTGILGQGFAGGDYLSGTYRTPGGGGGAGGLGQTPVSKYAGDGGLGLNYSITGSMLCYAGGGGSAPYWGPGVTYYGSGGACSSGGTSGGTAGYQYHNATSGVRGGGGGGGGDEGYVAGAGGDGIVIVRYQTTGPTFISTWNTSITGASNSTSISLPLYNGGTYDFTVDWGDLTTGYVNAWNDADANHSYATAGSYQVTINGSISGFRFNNGGDAAKLLSIDSFTQLKLGNLGGYFYGCSNLASIASNLNITGTTNMSNAFRGATKLTSGPANLNVSLVTDFSHMFDGAALYNEALNTWDVHSATNMVGMFANAVAFNQPLSTWDVDAVTDMNLMFNNTAFDQDISNWDITLVTSFQNFNPPLSTAHYDALLIDWSTEYPLSNVPLDMVHSYYSCAATAGRYALTNTYNWSISDLGVSDPTNLNITAFDELTNTALQNFTLTLSAPPIAYNYTITSYSWAGVLSPAPVYYVTVNSAGYAERVYSVITQTGSCIGLAANIQARLLPVANSTVRFSVIIQNSQNYAIPQSRMIISRNYNSVWLPVIDLYVDDSGFADITIEEGNVYLVTIDAPNYVTKQFPYQFYSVNSPIRFTLLSSANTPYTDIFNDVQYSYSPTSTSLNATMTNFVFNVLSANSILEEVSINSSLDYAADSTPNLVVLTSPVDLSASGGTTYPVTYCIKEQGAAKYCFTVNYYVEANPPSTNNFLTAMQNFQTQFTGTGSAWLTVLALFCVLAMCIIVSSIAFGDPVVTTLTGFAGIIFFAFVGWLSPIISGFICVVGLGIFFFNRVGGS